MASSIATSVAQKLGALLVDEAKYLYQVSDKIKGLQNELEWMACFLEDADNREHQERIVHKWVSEIREIAYDAEDVIDRYLHGVSHHRKDGILNAMKWASVCIVDAITLHFVGSSIDELRARISDLIPRMQMYGIRSVGRSKDSIYNFVVKEQRRAYSHIEDDPIGLEAQSNAVVWQLLHNEEANVIGISGMGGLGKTTLARKVFANSAIKEQFQSRCAWIYLSKEFDRRKAFEDILVGLCSNEEKDIRETVEKLRDDELPNKICEVLKTKGCFVVIDDIWYTHSWDSLKSAFGSIKGSNSKILITTRNEGLICHADHDGYSHRSDKLNEVDSWELFRRKTFYMIEEKVSLDVKNTMEKLGREMVNHCDGLPLAILALGGILATKGTVEEWEIVRKNIRSYLMFETVDQNVNGEVPQMLELSYCDLPFYLKPCFLYMGSFPEDYEIESDRLYHLWEAEGLVCRANKRTRIEGVSLDDVAESYLNQLVQRSMVEVSRRSSSNGRIKSCRLHDVMRDMCLQKCEDLNFLSTVNGGSFNTSPGSIASSYLGHAVLRRCALYFEKDSSWPTPELENFANVRSLLFFLIEDYPDSESDTCKQLQSMSRLFSQLRVLDLQGYGFSEGLPKALKSCIHLRYLNLGGVSVDVLPEWISHLEYLETLDLRVASRKNFDVVYRRDFQKLGRLRHLYLPEHMSLGLMQEGEKVKLSDDQLLQMQTLKNFNAYCFKKGDLAKMVNLRIFTIGGLSSYRFDDRCLEEISKSPVISSGRLINRLRKVTIDAKIINENPTGMAVVRKCLKGITIKGKIEKDDAEIFGDSMKSIVLHGCEIGEIHVAQLEKLPRLESLKLYDEAFKGSKLTFSKKAFPHLVHLHMNDMGELEEWVVGNESLPHLRSLRVEYCAKLKSLPECLPLQVRTTYIREMAYDGRIQFT